MAKKGRKPQHYRDPETGMEIHGLARRPCKPGKPGRFYVIKARNVTWSDPPKIAIAKYRARELEQRGVRPMLVFGVDDVSREVGDPTGELKSTNGDGAVVTPDADVWDRFVKIGADYDGVPDHQRSLIMGSKAFEESWAQYAAEYGLPPEGPAEGYGPGFIDWTYGRFIKTDPIGAAQALGDPRIRNLDAAKLPEPSLRLSEVVTSYLSRTTEPTDSQRRFAQLFEDFAKIVGTKTVRQIEHEHIELYNDRMRAEYEQGGFLPCWLVQRFSAVKTIFAHALTHKRQKKEIEDVLRLLKMLVAPLDNRELKPTPVSREYLHALLKHADVRMKAIILVGLNCAFYPIDICHLPLFAVDLDKGVVTFPRTKARGRAITRYAVLWERTVEAIKEYQRAHPHEATDRKTGERLLFGSKTGLAMWEHKLYLDLCRLKEQAGTPDFVFSHLRDGAETRPAEASIDATQTTILKGHKLPGQQDAYLLRGPVIVAPACAAIEKYYFG